MRFSFPPNSLEVSLINSFISEVKSIIPDDLVDDMVVVAEEILSSADQAFAVESDALKKDDLGSKRSFVREAFMNIFAD